MNTEPACSGFRGRIEGHWCCFLSPKPSRHATIGRFGRKPRRPTVAPSSLHQRPLVAWPNPQMRPLVALRGNLGDQWSHKTPLTVSAKRCAAPSRTSLSSQFMTWNQFLNSKPNSVKSVRSDLSGDWVRLTHTTQFAYAPLLLKEPLAPNSPSY